MELGDRQNIEGPVRWVRSSRKECICCEGGRHIYVRHLDADWQEFVMRNLRSCPENAVVRISMEIVSVPPPKVPVQPAREEAGAAGLMLMALGGNADAVRGYDYETEGLGGT